MKRLGILTAVHTAQVLNRSATTTTTTTTTIKSTTASTSTTASADAGASQTQTTTSTTGIPSVLLSNVVAAHQDRGGRDLIYNNMSSNIRNGGGGRFESDLHGNVNILLGGAMLGGVIMIVFFVCYCCHKSIRKNRPSEYSQYWRTEPDINSLEVYTMDSHSMCFDRNAISLGHQIVPEELHHHHHHHQSAAATAANSLSNSLPARPLTPGPPPAYESLIFKPGGAASAATTASSPSDKKPEPASLSPLSCILPVPDDEQQQQQQQQQEQQQEQQQQQHQHQHHSSSLKEVESRREDEGLPTYEAALKLEAHGYV
ncbi:uncharacterized protein LOC106652944 [Trichogramma pretiosum]|uniref:uncharacterized protein LOC106652944 n=1 Tax=Trichogramma pretiosum TaxID=7493 RepID=UPI0006C959B4|nr:uncharacterized protein LOC106652944 [Trichogramma pretiosum]